MIASVVLLTLLSAPMPRQAATNPASRPANVDKEATNKKKTPALSPVQNPVTAHKAENASNTPASESEPRRVVVVSGPSKDTWDKVYICLTAALVFIGLLTLGAICFQAVKTREAADAAKKNITAFIDSERAWLMGDEIGILPPPDPDESRSVYWMSVPVKNFGKTVARVFESTVWRELYATLPPTPEYPQGSTCDIVVVPGDAHKLHFGIRPPDLDYVRQRSSPKRLYVIGYVKYRDIGNTERETRFCYFYHVPTNYAPDPEGFYPCGNAPESYTKCT